MLNTSFSNKTHLKIKNKIIFFTRSDLWTGPDPVGTVETLSTIQVNRRERIKFPFHGSAEEKQLRAAFNDTAF